MSENENRIFRTEGDPNKTKVTRVTDLDEVKKLFKRPKPSEDGLVQPLGDEEFFGQVQEWVADSGAILKGHFLVDEE